MNIGYIVGSHVVQNAIIIPRLLESMERCAIDLATVAVCVSGAGIERIQVWKGVTFVFVQPECACLFQPLVEHNLGERLGVTHWFALNGTGECGPDLKRLVESGAVEDADSVHASFVVPPGRTIDGLGLYRDDYLHTVIGHIREATEFNVTERSITEYEGIFHSLAPRKASYPNAGAYSVMGDADFYQTGIIRRHYYWPSVDWHRYKRNYGQLDIESYDRAII